MSYRKTATLLSCLALLSVSARGATINAGDALNVAGLSAGESFQILFVSDSKIQRDVLDGADDGSDNSTIAQWNAWINLQADSSTITGFGGLNFSAIVSLNDGVTPVNAKDNAVISGPVYLANGSFLFTDAADAWDGSGNSTGTALPTAIVINEDGNAINTSGSSGAGRLVWTGSNNDGNVTGTYPGANGTQSMMTGNSVDTDDDWITNTTAERRGPDTALRVYGLSEVITIVPEPSSLALLGLGGLLIARRRRA